MSEAYVTVYMFQYSQSSADSWYMLYEFFVRFKIAKQMHVHSRLQGSSHFIQKIIRIQK
jgi:hypothetical protein